VSTTSKLRQLAAGALFVFSSSASAAVVFDFVETPSGSVVGTLSGSLNLEGLSGCSSVPKTGIGIGPNSGSIFSGLDGPGCVYQQAFTTSPLSFGSGGTTLASSATGDLFVTIFGFGALNLPAGYASGNALSGSLTFLNATFASLGITAGSYVLTMPNDTVTLSFRAVPEPGTLALLSLGLVGMIMLRRRRA